MRIRPWLTSGNAGSVAGGLALLVLQSAAHAQAKPTGLAAYESLLTTGFFILLAGFAGLFVWEVIDNKKASRSSLDIAKLAAAAAKKQSAAGAPSGSLAALDAPPTSRPFAPPPPPPPPKQPTAAESSVEQSSPFATTPREEAANPFAAPPSEMLGAGGSMGSVESTVAFSPTGGDPGSSGGWADLLQRVRAGEPEAASFQDSSPPPLTEDESFVMPSSEGGVPASPGVSPASSSEAWEALLKRTTTGEGQKGVPKTNAADIGKISLNSNMQLPGEAASSPFSMGMDVGAPEPSFPSSEGSAPVGNMFGSSFDDGATLPSGPPAFSLPSAPSEPSGAPAGMGFSFSSDPTTEPSSPFGGAFGSGGFESPSFKLPGSPAPADDFGGGPSGGFQLPSGGGAGAGFGGGANPFDFGSAGNENPSSSTLPLTDLFSPKPSAGGPPAFQLPGSGGAAPEFPAGLDSDLNSPGGLGRTISLDFAKGGGQKPPPPLPKTEG